MMFREECSLVIGHLKYFICIFEKHRVNLRLYEANGLRRAHEIKLHSSLEVMQYPQTERQGVICAM